MRTNIVSLRARQQTYVARCKNQIQFLSWIWWRLAVRKRLIWLKIVFQGGRSSMEFPKILRQGILIKRVSSVELCRRPLPIGRPCGPLAVAFG